MVEPIVSALLGGCDLGIRCEGWAVRWDLAETVLRQEGG